jgi:hypothetical protein
VELPVGGFEGGGHEDQPRVMIHKIDEEKTKIN